MLNKRTGRKSLSPLQLLTAAFVGAFTAGILVSLLKKYVGYPRISIIVPPIVIMVPVSYLSKLFTIWELYSLKLQHRGLHRLCL